MMFMSSPENKWAVRCSDSSIVRSVWISLAQNLQRNNDSEKEALLAKLFDPSKTNAQALSIICTCLYTFW